MAFSGFINVHKEEGMTSHDVVSKMRKILGMRKIGHAGTLDPFATGVLPLAIGSSTRLIRFLKKSKKYMAEVNFNFQTDTDDLTGEELSTLVGEAPFHVKNTAEIDLEELKSSFLKKLEDFLGEIEQIPPLYSAVHHNGKRLYELMRSGEELDLSDVKRRIVKVKNIKLLEFNYPIVRLEISCGEGTYLRSIARDLGGHLTKLERLESNGFEIESALHLEDLANEEEPAEDHIISGKRALDLPLLKFSEKDCVDLQQGKRVFISDKIDSSKLLEQASGPDGEKMIQCLDSSEELLGIGSLVEQRDAVYVQPKVIL